MKNIYKYIFAAMLTLGTTTSCSDFLDEAPKGVIGTLIRSTFGLTATCRQTIA